MEHSGADIDYLKAVYSTARNKYKPSQINTLLIAEAPPCALDRDFYFEDVKVQDSLFLEIMGVLYPTEKEKYVKKKRDAAMKEDLLTSFREDGYWMIDVSEIPTSIDTDPLDSFLPALIAKLEKYITKKTPIILIKSNVYDICYQPLKDLGYHVIDERMPFPGSGQQKVFREKFANALTAM